MKNYFIGFILVLISLFSFSNYISADSEIYFNNEQYISFVQEKLENYDLIYKLNDLINYIDINLDYDWFISLSIYDNSIYFEIIIFEDIFQIENFFIDNSENYIQLRFYSPNKNIRLSNSLRYSINFDQNDIDYQFSLVKDNIINFNSNSYFGNYYGYNLFMYKTDTNLNFLKSSFIIHSSFDIILQLYNNEKNNIVFSNGFVFEEGKSLQEFISNYNYLDLSKIKITKTYANDLENNDIYNIRADFVDIYNSSYKYEFKTNSSDWVDITSYIKDSSLYGYYIYDYVTYFNDVISFRVLDSNNEVIDENSIEVSELSNEPVFPIEGYKKVTIPAGYHYGYISGIKQGRVYWLLQTETSKIYSNLYYDNSKHDWDSVEFPIRINERNNVTLPFVTSYALNWFTYQDFDITQVDRSEFILLEKYSYLEGNDIYSVDYWIPEDAYFSLVKITENDQGGNDFDYEWKDPDTGEVNSGSQSSSSDTTNDSFFTSFNDALNYFKDIIIGIFEEVSYLFNNLPIILKYFFMVIFVLILFIFLIRFIL